MCACRSASNLLLHQKNEILITKNINIGNEKTMCQWNHIVWKRPAYGTDIIEMKSLNICNTAKQSKKNIFLNIFNAYYNNFIKDNFLTAYSANFILS